MKVTHDGSFYLLGTLSGGNCGVTSSRSRSFDVSSLIGLSPNDNSRQQRSGSCSPPTPAAVVGSRMAPHCNPSPNVSVGLPAPPPPTAAAAAGPGAAPPVAPAGLYPFLLHPGLYQHLITGMNPMLLNAQIQALNPLLYAGGHGLHPGLLQVQQAAATAERLRSALASSAGSSGGAGSTGSSHRYSPYPLPSPPASSSLSSLGSPTSGGGGQTSSAFSAVKKSHISSELKSEKSKSPEPVSKGDVKSESSELKSEVKNEASSESEAQQHPLASDIKSMEKLVNGLNGSSASKFGISHNNNDQQISA